MIVPFGMDKEEEKEDLKRVKTEFGIRLNLMRDDHFRHKLPCVASSPSTWYRRAHCIHTMP